MKMLIVATSKKPVSFEEEIKKGLRYHIEYLELCDYFSTPYMDYDPPWMHENQMLRSIEERIHLDFYWAKWIANLVNKHNYDMVISMSERIAVPLGLILPTNIKHIAILLNALSRKWLTLIRFTKVYQKWDKIITNSYSEAQALRNNLNIGPDQITTIHNCVDLEFYDPSAVKSSDESNGLFIMSQGLSKRDYPTLISALWKLPHVKCHISAVSAWDKHRSPFKGLKIPDNVSIKSYDHPYKIRNALAECQFLVVPLKTDVGMWCAGSSSVLEAQAMGKPVIVTKLPGTSEYVKDKETGLLVNGNDSIMLAEKIDFLWHCSDEARIMGNNGRAWIRENFSINNWKNKMGEVIEELST